MIEKNYYTRAQLVEILHRPTNIDYYLLQVVIRTYNKFTNQKFLRLFRDNTGLDVRHILNDKYIIIYDHTFIPNEVLEASILWDSCGCYHCGWLGVKSKLLRYEGEVHEAHCPECNSTAITYENLWRY